jgi:hypothetical protein
MAEPKEKELDIRNIKASRCPICHTKELSKHDRDLFFRRMTYQEFSEQAKSKGYAIPETDFLKHMMKHVFVYQPLDIPDDVSSENILSGIIGVLRAQLRGMEEIGETNEFAYTKKCELIKNLIELRGKYEGAYTQKKSEMSKDFQAEMTQKLSESVNDPDFAQFMEASMKEAKDREKKAKENATYESYESQQ